jgi:protein SCO1/2
MDNLIIKFKQIMTQKNRFGIVSCVISMLLLSCTSNSKRLPIYGEKEVVHRNVNGKDVIDTTYKTIPDFHFLNQDSSYLTNTFFDGKIYVADFFFTHCPSICPVMHRNLSKVYRRFTNNRQILFLSYSVDFKQDRPSVLKEYANRLGVFDNRWQFVTGPKDEMYTLAEHSYLSAAQEAADAPGGYAHSGYLLLIDRQRRLRGMYEGTDDSAVKRLAEDIEILLDEK